jgi:hypothetical protein
MSTNHMEILIPDLYVYVIKIKKRMLQITLNTIVTSCDFRIHPHTSFDQDGQQHFKHTRIRNNLLLSTDLDFYLRSLFLVTVKHGISVSSHPYPPVLSSSN